MPEVMTLDTLFEVNQTKTVYTRKTMPRRRNLLAAQEEIHATQSKMKLSSKQGYLTARQI